VACCGVVTRCSVRNRNFSPVHTESRFSSLGSPEMVNCLHGMYKRPLAHLWRKNRRPNEGLLQCGWTSQQHRHLISGYSFHFGIGAISWSSKKQNIITLSSTESEYIAQTHAAKEAIWIQSFIAEVQGKEEKGLTLLCDNQGAIALAKDNRFHSRTKHIDLRYHFIHETV